MAKKAKSKDLEKNIKDERVVEKEKKKEVSTNKEEKKDKKLFVILGVILLIILAFLLWLFNRKFEVRFDYNDGRDDKIVYVKYNKMIKSKEVDTKKKLGDAFIGWFLVTKDDKGKEKIANKEFDFKTKIKEKTKLRAIYKAGVKRITISFDTRGGSAIESIAINKGSELSLPENPTRDGYDFKNWEDKNGNVVNNNTSFEESSTLYAVWEKTEEEKTASAPTPVEQPKVESISLSIDRSLIHRNGYGAKATANVVNASGSVRYELVDTDTRCATVNSSTGDIRATGSECSGGAKVTVKAILPSGKSATATTYIEKDLGIRYTFNDHVYYQDFTNDEMGRRPNTFTLFANQDVSWTGTCNNSYSVSVGYTIVKGETAGMIYNSECVCYNASGDTREANVKVVATTKGGQRLTASMVRYVA